MRVRVCACIMFTEAMKAIVEYSESAVELLRRKKMRRDILFQYLADCSSIVSVNAEKHVLIQKVLEHWGSSVPAAAELRVSPTNK